MIFFRHRFYLQIKDINNFDSPNQESINSGFILLEKI